MRSTGGASCEGLEVTCGGGYYLSEASWSILTGGNVLLSGGAPYNDCLDIVLPEIYVVNMEDSYGDGWNGNELSINGSTYTLQAILKK